MDGMEVSKPCKISGTSRSRVLFTSKQCNGIGTKNHCCIVNKVSIG